ncbi:MAG: hypothetical protein AAGH73_08350 [Pseudomonadota bacterium]
MGTQSFFASDTITALELVEKTFGEDALILSVEWSDDRVEVRATDLSLEEVKAAAPPLPRTAPAPVPAPTTASHRPSFLDPARPSPFDRDAAFFRSVRAHAPTNASAGRDAP